MLWEAAIKFDEAETVCLAPSIFGPYIPVTDEVLLHLVSTADEPRIHDVLDWLDDSPRAHVSASELVEAIKLRWRSAPDQRLGQLIYNATRPCFMPLTSRPGAR